MTSAFFAISSIVAFSSAGVLLYDAVDEERLDSYSLIWSLAYIVSLFGVLREVSYAPLSVALYLCLVILSLPHIPESRTRRVWEAGIVFVATFLACTP